MTRGWRAKAAAVRLGFALAATGCAGASTTLVAPEARYPVSLTRGVRDADRELVPAERRQVVGRFEENVTAWGLLYSAISVTPTTDLSDAINAQIAARGGDAVVGLRVATAECALDFFFLLNMLPIWPGCTLVRAEGDIIRVLPASPKAVAPIVRDGVVP
jgi:hypothetical protein